MRASKLYIHFWRLLLGGSNGEICGDRLKKKKFFINNSVETLFPFKKKHQVILKLHLRLGIYPKEEIFCETEKQHMRGISESIEILSIDIYIWMNIWCMLDWVL